MSAFYNESDAFAAEWLRALERDNRIAAGVVDGRSIRRLRADQLDGFTQAHFFAGIGGWSHALRLAGWPDTLPVWTGSCPCQPFSDAGVGDGLDDPRHLWPAWFKLIEQCRPPVIFGEQVASPDGLEWLDVVSTDLEGAGYAVAAADLCAAGIGAPHKRQRLYFVADAGGLEGRLQLRRGRPRSEVAEALGRGEARPLLADAVGARRARSSGAQSRGRRRSAEPDQRGELGDAGRYRDPKHARELPGDEGEHDEWAEDGDHSPIVAGSARDFWGEVEWLPCADGRIRPIEPGPQPLADGFSERLGPIRRRTVSAMEEMIYAAISEADARKALRDLYCAHAAKTIEAGCLGRLRRVHEAPILLSFMRQLSREGWHLLDHLPPACWESAEAGLRTLLTQPPETARSSSGRKSIQQLTGQSEDALSVVSQALAFGAEQDWVTSWPLATNTPNRVGKLRGFGNAIVPELAAQFILAAIEAAEERR